MDKINSKIFFQAWVETILPRKDDLLNNWTKPRKYTSQIMGGENSVMKEVAMKLGLCCYDNTYYHSDTILYHKDDLVPEISENEYWFRDIRVVFEHENVCDRRLFQEVSHLLILNCDLRVLVTYPYDEGQTELAYLHKVISGNRQSKQISDDESFLMIFGWENDFTWYGYVYNEDDWKKVVI